MTKSIARSMMLFALLVAIASPVSAQATGDGTVVVAAPQASVQITSQAPVLGASFAPVGVTNKLKLAPVSVQAGMSTGEHVGSNRAMMGAGIAAVLIGLIVGGDVGTLIAVGGAVFALVGLYRYMK